MTTDITTGTTTATTALVPVFAGTLQGQSVQLCDARTLHAFMAVLRDFSNWIKGRIDKFKFVEGVDYLLAKTGEQVPHQGGTRNVVVTDYHLTLDMAKELSMVENNEKGREARRYFIACEKQALAQASAPLLPSVINPAQAQHLRELVQLVVESGKQGHGETWNRLHRKMKVNSYLMLRPDQFNAAVEYLHGKFDDTSLAAIAAKHFPQLAQLPAPPMKNPEAPTLPFSLDTLVQFLSSGLTEKSALLKVATTSGMALYINVWNEAKDTGWGQQVANQIDGTLPQADLNIIVTKAVQELWTRNLSQTEAGRPVPQRVTH